MDKNPLSSVIIRTCTDKSFREEFLRDPAGVLSRSGIQVPEGVVVKVVENTDENINIVLPTSLEDQPASWSFDKRRDPGEEVRSGNLTAKWTRDGLCLSGRVSSDVVQMLRQELDRVDGDLLIDFAEVTFMGSAGLGAFLAAQKRLASSGKQLYLCDVPPPIRNVFSLSGLSSLFQFVSRDMKQLWWISAPLV